MQGDFILKLKSYVTIGLTALSLSLGLSIKSTTAHAIKDHWNSAHWVTVTKDEPVYKIKNQIPVASSYKVGSSTVKRGTHILLEHWGVDYSWVLQSGRFNSNSKYTYIVDASYKGGWFKAGIHNLSTSKYKPFHGYRIEGYKSLYTYNTFYDTDSHATLSDYRPTQKSKIIFEYGSHVYPTNHEWTWFHGAGQNTLTNYRFIGGTWVRKDTTTVADN